MLMIDLNNSCARITVSELLADSAVSVSGAATFAKFLQGWMLNVEQFLDPRWQLPGGASSSFVYFKTVLHELLPATYDVGHLDTLGGRFALRLRGVGEFTISSINRRVITLQGLPLDDGMPVIDAEMGGDIFMAICNERLAAFAEEIVRAAPAGRVSSAAPN